MLRLSHVGSVAGTQDTEGQDLSSQVRQELSASCSGDREGARFTGGLTSKTKKEGADAL